MLHKLKLLLYSRFNTAYAHLHVRCVRGHGGDIVDLQAIDKAEQEERQAERESFGRAFAAVGITLPENDKRDPSLRKR